MILLGLNDRHKEEWKLIVDMVGMYTDQGAWLMESILVTGG